MEQVLRPDGSLVDPNNEPDIPDQTLLKMYEAMIQVRLMDAKGMRLQRQGRIGFHIPTTGQEATQIGAVAALEGKDWLFPAYREPGMALYRGLDLHEVVDQWFGNANDPQKGRRIPGLFGEREKIHFVNASAPIGTQIVHAAGGAYAAKYLKDGSVNITFFGDGATSSNDFHAGMNFAGVTKSPTIFFCQNNQWAISVPFAKQTAAESVVVKGQAYGVPSIQVDGNDILAVYKVVYEAAERGRRGEGPTLVEALTYRVGPHTSSDDPSRYRPTEEVEEQQKRDPIARFELYLRNRGLLDDARVEEIRKRKDTELNEVIRQAEEVPPPPLETMFTDVFKDMHWRQQEQYEELVRVKRELEQEQEEG